MRLIATDLAEMPPRRRPSKYDELLEHLDGNCVVMERGEVDGFDEQTSMSVIRAALGKWARSRGVEIELRYLWFDWSVYVKSKRRVFSPFEIDGEPVPWGLMVQVRSPEGETASSLELRLIAGSRP